MGINLYDVMPLVKNRSSGVPKSVLEDHTTYTNEVDATVRTLRNLTKAIDVDVNSTIEAVLTQYNKTTRTLLVDHFAKTLVLPNNISYREKVQQKVWKRSSYEWEFGQGAHLHAGLDRMNRSPRAKLVDLVEISKIANMIIIPFEYLEPKSYTSESYGMRSSIDSFVRVSKECGFDSYVIAPLRHYSILKHLNAADPNGQIVGNAYQQNFDVLSMMLPAMLMFSDRLSNVEGGLSQLYSKVDTLDASMKGIVRGLESMERQLTQLQAKVEQQQQEMLAQRYAQEQLIQAEQRASNRSSTYSWFMAYEPLLFAVQRGASLASDCQAVIGPCWGPDFDEIVAAALEFKIKKGQRAILSQTVSEIW